MNGQPFVQQTKAKSYGCELQPLVFDRIEELKSKGLLNHIQVTIPNTITFNTAHEFSKKIATIAHCNILNTFGENNWSELAPMVAQIRALNPVHVVEHFTAFRPSENEKTGVYFDLGLTRPLSKLKIIDGVNRWQEMIDRPLCLENISIAENVEAYFDLLLEVREKTGCGIACDLPHFFLSVYSAGFSEERIRTLAGSLRPKQLHVGGLSITNGVLKDNHKGFSPWILQLAHSLFSEADYITLEQNHLIPASVIEKQLNQCRLAQHPSVPAEIKAGIGIALAELNDELAKETAINAGVLVGVRTSLKSEGLGNQCESSLEFYNKYQPFFSPIASLEQCFDNLSPEQAVEALASVARWSLYYQSWWRPETPRFANVSYGEGSKTFYSAVVSDDTITGENQIENENKRRFESKRGFWCEIATPGISINEPRQRSIEI